MSIPPKLTKADTVALWHAVDDMDCLLRGMKMNPPCTAEQVADQQARLLAAKRALRKAQP
ncbi:MAG: hypothetical protein EOP74_00150 [Variovorax sp.]|nr:MAG: hypothetical protein EOP74_00150 [Variovorax sp.]